MLKKKPKRIIHRKLPTYRWLFEPNSSHIQVLGWLKKKEEEDELTIPSFDHFRLATLEQFLYTITTVVVWGSLLVYKLF